MLQKKSLATTSHHSFTEHHAAGATRTRLQQQPQRTLVHLHIGKNGGTSLDGLAGRIAKQTHRKYKGYAHFDWRYIQRLEHELQEEQQQHHSVDVITMLRHPVQRAISHFHSAKILMKHRLPQLYKTSLYDYVQNPQLLLQSRTVWFDGQAGVSWLTGTHTEPWVTTKSTRHARINDTHEQQQVNTNPTTATNENSTKALKQRQQDDDCKLCLLAADRLDRTKWFGILEDLNRSMELLQHAFGLEQVPSLPRANANPYQQRPQQQQREMNISTQEQQQKQQREQEEAERTLALLMPKDMWLYEYGKLLLEARYVAMRTGRNFVPPKRPPLPIVSCTSTEQHLQCRSGPLEGSHSLY